MPAVTPPWRAISPPVARLFDRLRGGSALVVTLAHAAFYWLEPVARIWLDILVRIAHQAVMVFFVISGFMVTSSILRRIHQHPGQRLAVGRFVHDRARRLLPPLWLALLLMVAVSAWLRWQGIGHDYWLSTHELTGSLLFLQGMGVGFGVPAINQPLWSLSQEVAFYAVATLLFLAVFNHRLYLLLLLLWLGVWLWLGSVPLRWLAGLLVWAGGSALAWAYHTDARWPLDGRRLSAGSLAVNLPVAVLLVVAAVTAGSGDAGFGRYLVGLLVSFALLPLLWRAVSPTGRTEASEIMGDTATGQDERSRNLCHTSDPPLRVVGWPVRARQCSDEWLVSLAGSAYTLYVIHYPLVLGIDVLTERWQTTIPGAGLITAMGLWLLLRIAKTAAVWLEPERTARQSGCREGATRQSAVQRDR